MKIVPEEDINEEEQVLCRLIYIAMNMAKNRLILLEGNYFADSLKACQIVCLRMNI